MSITQTVEKIVSGERLEEAELLNLLRRAFHRPIQKERLKGQKNGFGDTGNDNQNELVGILWEFAAKQGKRSQRTLWQKVLRTTTEHAANEEIRDRVIVSFLQLSFQRELTRLRMKGTPQGVVLRLLQDAVKKENFAVSMADARDFIDAEIFLREGIAATEVGDERIPELVKQTFFPNPDGRSQADDLNCVFPSPKQVRACLREIMETHHCRLTVRQCMEIVFSGFGIARGPQRVDVDAPHDGGGEETTRPSAEEMTRHLSIRADYPDDKELLDELVDQFIQMVESQDRGRKIDPSDRTQEGKLGRILTEFYLWEKWPLRDESRTYGIQMYADATGTAMQTEHDRLKSLRKIVTSLCQSNEMMTAEILQNLKWRLREKFWRRKPEKVADSPFRDE